MYCEYDALALFLRWLPGPRACLAGALLPACSRERGASTLLRVFPSALGQARVRVNDWLGNISAVESPEAARAANHRR